METIEQLKQDNEKLNARLVKAIEVFKEQKANIDALTKENEELKNASKNNVVSNEELDKLVADKENLNEQLKDKDVEIANYKDALESVNSQIKDLEKWNNDYELKLKDSETAYEQLHKKYEERKKQITELMGSQAANVETIKKEYESKITLLKEENIEVGKLKNVNKELIDKVKDLEDNLNQRVEQIRATEKTYDEEQKKIINSRDEWINKYKELENNNNSLQLSYNTLKEHCNSIKNDYNNLKENTISLNDYQKECKKLNEIIFETKKAYDTDLEKLRKLYEDTLLKLQENDKYRQFVEGLNTLAESVNINFKTRNIENKDTSKKITVIRNSNSTGSQFMGDAPGMNI